MHVLCSCILRGLPGFANTLLCLGCFFEQLSTHVQKLVMKNKSYHVPQTKP